MLTVGRHLHSRRAWTRAWLRAAILGVLCARAAAAHDDTARAITALAINGQPAADVILLKAEGAMWIPVSALRDAGVQTDGGKTMAKDGTVFISLDSLAPDVTYRFDEVDVVLRLSVVGSRFGAREVRVASLRPGDIERAKNASGFVNYAVTAANAGTGIASEAGVSVRGMLLHGSLSRDASGALLRGPLSLTMDDERRLRRWEIGDTMLGGGPFDGIVPIAGISVSRQFGIDPYFVQYTPLQIAGAATVPSVADVYVNGQLVRSVPVAPGSFTLRDLPVSVGAGQAEVVVRDAFGREQRIGSSFYTPASVLRPGLQAYQYGVGIPRQNVAADPARPASTLWAYSGWTAMGEHRVGVREGLTLGGRVEASGDVVGFGPSMAARLPLGELEAVVAASRADGRMGSAGLMAWSYRGRAFNAAVSWRGTTRDYLTLGDAARTRTIESMLGPRATPAELAPASSTRVITGATTVRSDAQASIGWRAGRRLNLTASYARLRDQTPIVDRTSTSGDRRWTEGRQERALVGASWQAGARVSVSASLGRSRSLGRRARPDVFVGMSLFLGERRSANVGVGSKSSGGTSVAVQRSLPIGPGYAYRMQARPDAGDADITLQAQGAYGRVELRSHRFIGPKDGAQTMNVSVMGAVAAIGGRVYATRPIDDAFALVRVSDVGGVRAYASNQYIGRTDRRGDIVVPNLVSYYGNRLSIAAEDVPLTYDIGDAERVVAPSLRGGALVRFVSATRYPIVGRFVLGEAGVVPALGEARASSLRDGEVSPLGRRGEFYFEQLEPGVHRINVWFEGRAYACSIVVPERGDPAGRPIDLGVVTCRLAADLNR